MASVFNFAGTQFASFTYTNSYGEVKTYNVLLGASYENAKLKDLATLQNASFTEERHEVARKTLIKAIEKNLDPKTQSNQSKGQQDAYESIGKGLRIHKESGDVHMLAYRVRVTQSEEQKAQTIANAESGNYKERKVVNSRQTTIDKKEVKKMLDLRETKIVQFKFKAERLHKAKINGRILEF
jgi:hypothetical protein